MKIKNAAFFICAQTPVVPLAVSLPGFAKTGMLEQFSRATGRKPYTLIGSLRDPAEIGGYPWVNTDSEAMDLLPPNWARRIEQDDKKQNPEKWVLFLDELTTVPPAVQAAMLRVISEGVVGDLALPEDCWIIAACNPPEFAANGFSIEPPAANRLCWLKWEMDWDSWQRGMLNGANFDIKDIGSCILPGDWRKKITAESQMTCAYQKHSQQNFEPKYDENGKVALTRAQLSGPWPSPRSWTNGAMCLAAAESVLAPKEVKLELLGGCVGEGIAGEYFYWMEHLDLPDPEDMIEDFVKNGEEAKYEHPDRPDKTIAMIAGINARLTQNPTKERFYAVTTIYTKVAEHAIDIALSSVQPIINMRLKIKGAQIHPGIMNWGINTHEKLQGLSS